MKRYLLDTNIWIYAMRNKPPQVRERLSVLSPEQVVMSPVVLGELHVGWRKSANLAANQRLLESFVSAVPLLALNGAVASAYGEIRVELERLGTPIGANDLWIAAHARAENCVLVTHDVREFGRVSGLRVEDWAHVQER